MPRSNFGFGRFIRPWSLHSTISNAETFCMTAYRFPTHSTREQRTCPLNDASGTLWSMKETHWNKRIRYASLSSNTFKQVNRIANAVLTRKWDDLASLHATKLLWLWKVYTPKVISLNHFERGNFLHDRLSIPYAFNTRTTHISVKWRVWNVWKYEGDSLEQKNQVRFFILKHYQTSKQDC